MANQPAKDAEALKRHDRFARFILQNIERAVAFFKLALHPEDVAAIDWGTLDLAQQSSASKSLKLHSTDLSYTARYKTGARLSLALIIEHKSQKAEQRYPIQYQLLEHITNHVKHHDDGQGRAALPILVVLYHGKQAWQEPSLPDYYKSANHPAGTVERNAQNVKFNLVDLTSMTDEALMAFYEISVPLYICLLVCKHVWDASLDQTLGQIAKDLINLKDSHTGRELLDAILRYIETAYKNKEEFKNVLTNIDETNTIMGFYTQELAEKKAEGIAEGKAKGIAEGKNEGLTLVATKALKAGKLTVEEIADLTDTDLTFVLDIQSKIKKGLL